MSMPRGSRSRLLRVGPTTKRLGGSVRVSWRVRSPVPRRDGGGMTASGGSGDGAGDGDGTAAASRRTSGVTSIIGGNYTLPPAMAPLTEAPPHTDAELARVLAITRPHPNLMGY